MALICLIRLSVIHRGRALPVVWRVITHESASVSFSGNNDPTPAIALLQQHEQRLYQLEFKVQTHLYDIC